MFYLLFYTSFAIKKTYDCGQDFHLYHNLTKYNVGIKHWATFPEGFIEGHMQNLQDWTGNNYILFH